MMLLSLLELFWTFFKIGLFTFGGGHAMIPLIMDEVVAKGWATQNIVSDFIAVSQSTPGVFAVNISTFIGYDQQGILGALVSTFGVSLPSFIIILIIAKIFHKFTENKYVIGFMHGAKPIIVGVIFSVAIKFMLNYVLLIPGPTAIVDSVLSWKNISILAIVLIVINLKKRVHPIFIVIISGLLGYIFFGIL